MANILQVTPPGINTDNKAASSGPDSRSLTDTQRVQNPVDPSRVVRADGQEGGRTQDATGEGKDNIIYYGSNYGAFLKNLGEIKELPALLERFLFSDLMRTGAAAQADMGPLMDSLAKAVRMESPDQLLAFLKGQAEDGTRFRGPFFDGLRMLFADRAPSYLKEAAMEFLRAYNSYASGGHFLEQIRAQTDDIQALMLRPFKGEFRELLQKMDWGAPNGQTAANTQVLNGSLIPFAANYISKTHDYGSVREAVMLLIMNAVRYENGEEGRVRSLFAGMAADRNFQALFKGEPEQILEGLLRQAFPKDSVTGDSFGGQLAALLEKGASGMAGLEHVQTFYTAMNGMLVNASVFMPLLHLILPFNYQGKEVVSEMWVDPDDGESSAEESRRIRMLLKFDVRSLGSFEMVVTLERGGADVNLFVPEGIDGQSSRIQREVGDILKKNGIGCRHLSVGGLRRILSVEDVFPRIREKERMINVSV